MLKAIGYCRVSTQEQKNKRNGIEGQIQAIVQFCEFNGIQLLDVREEEGADGAWGLDRRPVLAGCIDDCKAEGAILLTSRLDRFSRSVEFVSTQMNAFIRKKIRYAACDLGLDVEMFMLHIYASVAEKEKKLIQERTKAALDVLKAKGKPLGRKAHKGQGMAWEAIGEEGRKALSRKAIVYAESMRPLIEPMRNEGLTYKAIAERLNLFGVPTQRQKENHEWEGKHGWTIVSVRNVVMRWDQAIPG